MDSLKCQTSTATPAEPGDFPSWLKMEKSLPNGDNLLDKIGETSRGVSDKISQKFRDHIGSELLKKQESLVAFEASLKKREESLKAIEISLKEREKYLLEAEKLQKKYYRIPRLMIRAPVILAVAVAVIWGYSTILSKSDASSSIAVETSPPMDTSENSSSKQTKADYIPIPVEKREPFIKHEENSSSNQTKTDHTPIPIEKREPFIKPEAPLPAKAIAGKQLGERCLRDGECESGECKGFRCTDRIKPKGQIGDRCIFDGDCLSDECKKYRCTTNNRR